MKNGLLRRGSSQRGGGIGSRNLPVKRGGAQDRNPKSRHFTLGMKRPSASLHLKLYLGSFLGGCFRLEVCVVAVESEHGRRYVLGEQLDIGVVALHGFIVFAALHRNAVFGAGELILQPEEIL